ncbi:MAG: hypothetical protein IJH65_04410 [Methanobrevibacter sp.]|nr:hypothetical protein [Methanobrevibacter sp.]
MSEKRFYLTENGIQDKEYEFSLLGEYELVDIINGIVDENEQLRQKVERLQKENEELRQQQQRLFNYFNDYLKDEMDSDNFSEMWDNVKKDERWNDE